MGDFCFQVLGVKLTWQQLELYSGIYNGIDVELISWNIRGLNDKAKSESER